ncbi:hypothetical protein [Haloplanus halophilus]|uniref:hypothetical protein n=1 Tax=Haloplanus halophilus TaxID=2949993 RepID=UPI00203F09DA|nr:hypothetical protein [Haloplanus sp. GDY1]
MSGRGLTRTAYALFGAGLLAEGVVASRASEPAFAALLIACGLGVLVGCLLDAVRPEATVLGMRVGVGEQPAWAVLSLALGGCLLLAGAALRI